ncbi:MAG: IMP dehydrogenase [Candidatus Woesearchaeota archaeon]|jgi:IMP dehydrogenase
MERQKNTSRFSAKKLFNRGELTYNDFKFLNTIYSSINYEDIDLSVNLGKNIILKIPIIASPMDKVTNAKFCVAIANQGGIGCIHMNYKNPDGSFNIDAQISEITKVKRHENGFIEDPITLKETNTIDDAIKIGEQNEFGINIDTFPVIDEKNKLVGLLRKQDYSRSIHTNMKVSQRMIPVDKLIMGSYGITLEKANKILWDNHLLFLPIIDKNKMLKGLVTRSDIDKNEKYPLTTKDKNKRLRVLFAVDTKPEYAYDRLKKGFDAGADGVIIDTSQGFAKYEKEIIKYIRKNYGDVYIIGGNVSTKEGFTALHKWGVDAIRVGQGSGSICTTIQVLGTGRSSASGVYECSNISNKINSKTKSIADGGISYTGDILKAIGIGADAVMLGSMFAGTEESPGEIEYDEITNTQYKKYRGMGSKSAIKNNASRGYNRAPQGVEGRVPFRGPLENVIGEYKDALTLGLKIHNCRNFYELREKVKKGTIQFAKNDSPSSSTEMGATIRQK